LDQVYPWLNLFGPADSAIVTGAVGYIEMEESN